MPAEPTLAVFANSPTRYFFVTRPPFLTLSIVACLLGLASARLNGFALDPVTVTITVLGAVLIHAGVNVLNDYYDALNGTDEINTDRLYPFSGGSRFIQNGIFTPAEMAAYGLLLIGVGGLLGIVLAIQSGPGLWVIGGLGILLGWAYSAPPLSLNSRGVGEAAVAVGFGLLMPLGADYVQRGMLSTQPLFIGAAFALLVANILLINQFPDLRADRQSGKHHLVVRLGVKKARHFYTLNVILAALFLIIAVFKEWLPWAALLGLLPLGFSVYAARILYREYRNLAHLPPAIVATIMAALSHGVLLALCLWLTPFLS